MGSQCYFNYPLVFSQGYLANPRGSSVFYSPGSSTTIEKHHLEHLLYLLLHCIITIISIHCSILYLSLISWLYYSYSSVMLNVHEFFKTCILTISCLIAYYEFFPLIKNASCTSSFPYQISIFILRKVPIFFQKRTKNFACLFNCKHNSTHILKPNTYNSALFTKKAPLYNGTSSYPIYSKSSLSPEVLSHWQSAISFLFILLASVDCLQTIQF